jgi:catechol 2,3-dioxygenase
MGWVHLAVADLPRMLGFYQDVLGLRRAWTEGGGTVYLSATGRFPFHLALTEVPGATRPAGRTTGLYHTAFLLPSRAKLGGMFRRLVASAVSFDGAADHRVSEALYLRDPEGNGIELYADRPRDSWPRADGQVLMTTDPLDLDALASDGRAAEAAWDGIPADTRVGHVHLRVSALDRAEAFYHGVLGFDVTLRGYDGALFYSAGGYHHHLATNVWGSAGAGAPGPLGLCDFAIRLPDTRELARIVDGAGRAGVRVDGAVDHGLCVAVTMRDTDGIPVVLTVDRAASRGAPGEWTQTPVDVGALVGS